MNLKRHLAIFTGLMIILSLTLAVVPGALAAEHENPGEGISVQPARATWTTGFFLEAIYSRALEELGYQVEDPKKLANPIFYQSLQTGDVDFWANGWFPLHTAQLPTDFFEYGEIAGTVAAEIGRAHV